MFDQKIEFEEIPEEVECESPMQEQTNGDETTFSEMKNIMEKFVMPVSFLDHFLAKDISIELKESEIIQDLHNSLGPLTVTQIVNKT